MPSREREPSGARPIRRLILCVPLVAAVYVLLLGACSYTRSLVPDQSRFPSLRSPAYKDKAVVRLYACPVRVIGWLAVHPWFVVKKKNSRRLVRWEVVSFMWGGGFGYVRNNVPFDYDQGVSSFGGGHALAEVVGPEAERIGAIIERRSPHYPCRHRYRYFPGPNSNTYAQWILHITGWRIHLPPHAYGALWYRRCLQKKQP